jgi:hypothetical protein
VTGGGPHLFFKDAIRQRHYLSVAATGMRVRLIHKDCAPVRIAVPDIQDNMRHIVESSVTPVPEMTPMPAPETTFAVRTIKTAMMLLVMPVVFGMVTAVVPFMVPVTVTRHCRMAGQHGQTK